jgi:hypothetical protein
MCLLLVLHQSWQPGWTSLVEPDPDFGKQVERVIKHARDGTSLVRWKVLVEPLSSGCGVCL